jgi:hypothetical protein
MGEVGHGRGCNIGTSVRRNNSDAAAAARFLHATGDRVVTGARPGTAVRGPGPVGVSSMSPKCLLMSPECLLDVSSVSFQVLDPKGMSPECLLFSREETSPADIRLPVERARTVSDGDIDSAEPPARLKDEIYYKNRNLSRRVPPCADPGARGSTAVRAGKANDVEKR